MKQMMAYLKSLVDSKTNQSSGRFAFLFQVMISNIIVWYVWLFVCIYTRTIHDIPSGVVAAYMAANGIAFAGKYGQKMAERDRDDCDKYDRGDRDKDGRYNDDRYRSRDKDCSRDEAWWG